MSVLQITKICTLKCTYCFDKVHQQEARMNNEWMFMKDEDFYKYLSRMNEFFKTRKEEKSICISWWEPTLHPSFKKFIRSSLNDWFKIYLLSNFSFNEKIRVFLKNHFEKWTITCMTNINSPKDKEYSWMNNKLWENTIKNLEELQNPWIRLSFNIFDPDLEYDFIFDIVEKFPKLDKMIRIWIENTILPELKNRKTFVFHWELWEKYKKLWKVIDTIVEKLHKMWKSIYFDCWAWWCIFNENTIDEIKRNWWVIHWCSLPNDEVQTLWQYSTCYALYNYWNEEWKYNIKNNSMKQLRWISILQTEFYKNHYLILPKCTNCPLLEKWCPRFCVSNNIYYWNSIYKDWNETFKDKYYNKLSEDQKNYSYIEWCLSNFKFTEWKDFINKIWEKNYRYQLYSILLNFFINEDKKDNLDKFYELVNWILSNWEKLNKKDLSLAKLIELIIKNHKKNKS